MEDELNKSYLTPVYDNDEEDDDDDEFDEEIDEDGEDEISENILDNQASINNNNNNNRINYNNSSMQTGSLFGSTPSQSSPWGTNNNPPGNGWFSGGNNTPSQPSSSPWSTNNNNSSPWGQRSNGFSWGSNTGTTWGSSVGEKKQIDRTKTVIVCDVFDCLVETFQSNGKPGLLPRGIFDMRFRFDVWDKIACFNPEKIFAMVPSSVMNSCNGSGSWRVMLEYIVCSLSEYLRSPYQVCQILLQTEIGQPKEEILLQVLRDIPKESIVKIGVNSGLYGQNNKDQVAAMRCGIDYIDLATFLSSYV